MTTSIKAAHILAKKYPELANDAVSHYVAYLKDSMGPTRSSAVYSHACRAAPVGENPMGITRGSVVQIDGDRYLVLGCGFMTLELANLDRPTEHRTLEVEEFAKLRLGAMKVMDGEQSAEILKRVMEAPAQS